MADPTGAAGTWDIVAAAIDAENREACARGHHAWVPWLRLPNGSDTTWCCRPGCDATEQYDHA